MAATLDAVLDGKGSRPSSVTWAAVLGAVTGGVTLVASAIVVAALFGSAGGLLAWPVAVAQVAAGVLLITGAVRLATGAGRVTLVVGAALELLVCAAYLLFALTVVAHNPTEPPRTTLVMATIPVLFAVPPACALLLATRSTTTEHLRRHG